MRSITVMGSSLRNGSRSWLRQALADGPRPARDLQAEARALGIALRTFQVARKAEGIVTRKEQSLHGPWLLMLPPRPKV